MYSFVEVHLWKLNKPKKKKFLTKSISHYITIPKIDAKRNQFGSLRQFESAKTVERLKRKYEMQKRDKKKCVKICKRILTVKTVS